MNRKSAVLDSPDLHDTAADAPDTEVAEPAARRRESLVGAAMAKGRNAGESSIKLRTIVIGVCCAAVIAALAVTGWRWHTASDQVSDAHAAAAGTAHAEQVALDYATGAANMDFHNLGPWRTDLSKGTSPELSNRLTQASSSMEQIIVPLQWVSTAKPIAAKVMSESNGVYSVDCFVSVLTKNSQAPDGIQSTATYQLTIDSHNNWLITDIGGIDSALTPGGQQSAPAAPAVPAQPQK